MFAGPRKFARGVRRTFKELFYNSVGTLSLSRVALAIAIIQADAIVWLAVYWAYHLTVTNQMESGAQLVGAYFTGLSAILGTQVAGAILAQIFQMKFGGSIAGRQLDIEAARTEIAASDAEMGMSSPPGLVPVVPSSTVPDSQSEPRVAAESQSSTVALATAEPIEVEIVEGEK